MNFIRDWLNIIYQQQIIKYITLVCKKMHHVQKKAPPFWGIQKKVLNNKNNHLVKVKFMKKN